MCKTWFILIGSCLLNVLSFCQNTYIPDNNFEQVLIDLGYDSGSLDNFIPTNNITGITELDLNNKNIEDLTGIEDFKNLQVLDCSRNSISRFNVSLNTQLRELYCHGNQLSSIEVTQNPKLEVLWCYTNALQRLDISKNPNMISLILWENNISDIDITNNKEIVVFGCENNNISTLNLSNNPKLRRFQCRGNLLTELDLINNPDLRYLDCGENQLETLNLSKNLLLNTLLCAYNNLSELDLSGNQYLRNLECKNNQLCNLIINNGNNDNMAFIDFSDNQDLNCVVVDDRNGDHSLWQPASFSNYRESLNQCGSFIPIDELDDFIGDSYILPILINGNYFTESGGLGKPLYSGDNITVSQKIFIFKEQGCLSNESSFNVTINKEDYFIPKYFTPNNDGANDFWYVFDNNNSVNNITIYNRYGKLLKFLSGNSLQWDGTFNGEKMSSDTYWYEIVLNTGELLRGKFVLKR